MFRKRKMKTRWKMNLNHFVLSKEKFQLKSYRIAEYTDVFKLEARFRIIASTVVETFRLFLHRDESFSIYSVNTAEALSRALRAA